MRRSRYKVYWRHHIGEKSTLLVSIRPFLHTKLISIVFRCYNLGIPTTAPFLASPKTALRWEFLRFRPGITALDSGADFGTDAQPTSFLAPQDNLCRKKRCRRKTPHKNVVFFIFLIEIGRKASEKLRLEIIGSVILK